MSRRLTIALVAILAFGPATHATCRHCDTPAADDCHRGSTSPGAASHGGSHAPAPGSKDCACPAHHLSCVDTTGAVSVEPASTSYASPAPTHAPAALRHLAARDDAGGIARMGRMPPARARPPLHLVLRVLRI